jgi:hypothetical protein
LIHPQMAATESSNALNSKRLMNGFGWQYP